MDIKEKYKKYINLHMVKGIADVVVDRAEGSTIYDINGSKYIDCFSGISVNNVGHRNKKVVAAAKAQIDKFIHCAAYIYQSEPPALLAEKLAQITPGHLSKTFFSNSGAEAVEGALRIAKQFTGKYEFIALQASFHGRTNATLSITGNSGRKRQGGPYNSGVSFAPFPYCYRCPFDLSVESCEFKCATYIKNIINLETSGSVAAFIAEPVLGEGGIIVPPKGYFEKVKEILAKYDILFIADEVQTGFGRCGKLLAVYDWDFEPDIVAFAKGIAGGFPLSAFITTEEIAASFKPGDHLSTFGGNPVSCAAALANIEVLEEDNLSEVAAAKGIKIMEKLKKQLQPKHKLIGDVRGKGLMIGIELVKDEMKTPASRETASIQELCRQKGVLVGTGGIYGNIIRIQPPLVISENELEAAFHVLDEAITQLENK